MKRFSVFLSFLIGLVLLFVIVFALTSQVSALAQPQNIENIARGAQLYDDWTKIVSNPTLPVGDNPIWTRQSSDSRSGIDTWRCVSCHGWDYQGEDGANRSGANLTGFPGILTASTMTAEQISAILHGGNDPQHNYSSLINQEDIDDLASFIQAGLIDDNEFIDLVSRKVLSGDSQNGKQKYEAVCATCHGSDGTLLTFRYEGIDTALGTLAVQDPWRFLHRTRFGTARAPEMPIGINLNWTAQDGRDVAFYVQINFPTGFEPNENTPAVINPVENQGGPAKNIFSGILTAFGAMATSLGFAVLVGAVLIGIILLVVWLLRSRQS